MVGHSESGVHHRVRSCAANRRQFAPEGVQRDLRERRLRDASAGALCGDIGSFTAGLSFGLRPTAVWAFPGHVAGELNIQQARLATIIRFRYADVRILR